MAPTPSRKLTPQLHLEVLKIASKWNVGTNVLEPIQIQ